MWSSASSRRSASMMAFSGELARIIFDSRAALPARLGVSLKNARAQKALVSKWSHSLDIPVMDLGWLSEVFNPNRNLYILGSGESIEDVKAENWDEVSANNSIGFNAWPIHSFVPTALAFEPFNEASTDYVQLFDHVLKEPRFRLRKPGILLFRPNRAEEGDTYLRIPKDLLSNARLYGRFVPSSTKIQTVRSEILWLQRLQRVGWIAESLLPDSGASVIRLVSLGTRLGFKKIVLLGVDVNGGRYFWERNPSRLRDRDLRSFSPGFTRSVHQTMTRDGKPFILTEFLMMFQEIMQESGSTLFAGSPESALADFLPVHQWGEVSNQT